MCENQGRYPCPPTPTLGGLRKICGKTRHESFLLESYLLFCVISSMQLTQSSGFERSLLSCHTIFTFWNRSCGRSLWEGVCGQSACCMLSKSLFAGDASPVARIPEARLVSLPVAAAARLGAKTCPLTQTMSSGWSAVECLAGASQESSPAAVSRPTPADLSKQPDPWSALQCHQRLLPWLRRQQDLPLGCLPIRFPSTTVRPALATAWLWHGVATSGAPFPMLYGRHDAYPSRIHASCGPSLQSGCHGQRKDPRT